MQVEYLVIGQGLCGTWLSYYLQKAKQSFIVIDESKPHTASKVASGIINPVTGRRIVKTWMIDELLPFAWNAYQSIGAELGINCISQRPVIDCFATPQMRLSFIERYEKDNQFLWLPANENDWLPFINYDFGYGIVQPAYLIDILTLLQSQRKKLNNNNQLREEHFDVEQLIIKENNIEYKDISASKIIFCDGVAAFDNIFFPNLPYGLNKGEVMLAEIPGFPVTNIIKKGYSLVPWKENTFWLGSTYLWEFDNDKPTDNFYKSAEAWLNYNIKMPFRIIDHWSTLRPATLERKPFVGLHPVDNKIGILNGMGTKGCSLAPFFAQQLTNHLIHDEPIMAEANVQRFKRILSGPRPSK